MGLAALIAGPPLAIVLSSAPSPAPFASAGGPVPASSDQPADHTYHVNLLELRPRTPLPSPTPAPTPTPTPRPKPAAPSRTPAVVIPPAASGSIVAIIEAAAARWGVSGAWMVGIAECESSLRSNAYNPGGPYYGLFQFLMSTFVANGGTNIWDPTDQANIAAKMLAHGQAWQWACA